MKLTSKIMTSLLVAVGVCTIANVGFAMYQISGPTKEKNVVLQMNNIEIKNAPKIITYKSTSLIKKGHVSGIITKDVLGITLNFNQALYNQEFRNLENQMFFMDITFGNSADNQRLLNHAWDELNMDKSFLTIKSTAKTINFVKGSNYLYKGNNNYFTKQGNTITIAIPLTDKMQVSPAPSSNEASKFYLSSLKASNSAYNIDFLLDFDLIDEGDRYSKDFNASAFANMSVSMRMEAK